jgi:uncharacterized protein HemY
MSLSSESAIPSLQRQLSAAEGWLELGDLVSAHDELEEIAPRLRAHPQVLVMRCRIYGQARRWESALIIAERLVALCPQEPQGWIQRSICLHALKQTQAAFDTLLCFTHKCDPSWNVAYDLARYATQLGQIRSAEQWLQRAIQLGDRKQVKLLALCDDALAPLFQSLPS